MKRFCTHEKPPKSSKKHEKLKKAKKKYKSANKQTKLKNAIKKHLRGKRNLFAYLRFCACFALEEKRIEKRR